MELQKLKDPMPYQWRVQSFSKFKPQASCVAYIDARDVMEVLDSVCGAENWQSDYKAVDGQMFAGIGILTSSVGEWVWKWDTGSESNIEAEKGQASDSFKRAAVKWGIGRFLYDLPIKTLPASEVQKIENNRPSNHPFVVDEQGQRVWDLSKHINSLSNAKPVAVKAKPEAASVKVAPPKVVADKQKAEIARLVDDTVQVPLKVEGETPEVIAAKYRAYVLEQTGLKLEPQNYTQIIERLKALQ